MTILEQILDNIKEDEPIQEVRRGLRCTALVSRGCGLSSTCIRECSGEDEDFIGRLAGMDALGVSRFSLSDKISEASVGMAAVNSLINVDDLNSTMENASEIIKEKGKDKNVAIIGHFPFTEEIRSLAKNLWVIEKWLRPGDLPESDASKYLPDADMVAISGTTLINHTIDKLVGLCRKDSSRILLGPSAPFSPVLFDYGFDFISGSTVTDKETCLKLISEGANFRQLKKVGCVNLLTAIRKGNR